MGNTKQSQFKNTQVVEITKKTAKLNWLCFGFGLALDWVCFGFAMGLEWLSRPEPDLARSLIFFASLASKQANVFDLWRLAA